MIASPPTHMIAPPRCRSDSGLGPQVRPVWVYAGKSSRLAWSSTTPTNVSKGIDRASITKRAGNDSRHLIGSEPSTGRK